MLTNVFPFFQKMKQYFIKRGKKHTMENLFRMFLFRRAEMKRKDFHKILLNVMLNSMPKIKLKSRKRGRNTIYKIKLLYEKGWKERKALGSFSKVLREHSENKFIDAFEKELEGLHNGKSSIQIKRDEYHKLVLRTMPFFWTIKKRKKTLKIRKKTTNKWYLWLKKQRVAFFVKTTNFNKKNTVIKTPSRKHNISVKAI